ncbi:MAG: homocysteine S-methyltransferase family protein [Acidobacteria bacterium]|nr:homocysteine S-methyltransferase family protein [Acidobacteriota bacterium]
MRYNRLSAMNFLEALRERVLVAEGAMGTRLLSKGISPDVCLEALNLTNPTLIREIHEEYRAAGAEILKTNTFGANIPRLARHNLEAKCREINIAAVQIARSVAGQGGLVAGVVGPLGESANLEAGRAFNIQIEALAEAGANFILLETFRNLYQLRDAIHAAREVCDLPVVAQVSPDQHGNLENGLGPEVFVSMLVEWGADAIGCNCGAGLAAMLDTIRRMALLTDQPLTAQPSAGLPFFQEGRAVYPCLPEELADAARQLAQMGVPGVRIVGACCGTTPDHITAIRRAVHSKRASPFPTPAPGTTAGRRPLLSYHPKDRPGQT